MMVENPQCLIAVYLKLMNNKGSTSRAAQEQLSKLAEKSSPLEDQLAAACTFVGHNDLDGNLRLHRYLEKPLYYGRQEWLLRWLLKKLQGTGETGSR